MPLSQLLNQSAGELQAELQLILNAIVEGLCGVDIHDNVTFCNEALLKMTGYRAEELVGKSVHGAIHHRQPDGTSYPEEECALRTAIERHQEIHVVGVVLWRKDGTCFPAEYWAHPLLHPSGPTVSVVMIQDISERERSIEALKLSEERFRLIANNIDQVFYLLDVNASRLIYLSPAFETITGLSCQEACAKSSPWLDIVVPGHQERINADYCRLLQGEETRNEYQIRHRDGSTRWIKCHAKPVRDRDGQVRTIAGVIEDISEIHKSRDTLQQSEEKFRRILASVAEVAWTSDRHGRTTYISPKVEDVLGYTKQEISAAGSTLRLGLIHPSDFGRVNQSYLALFDSRTAFDQEYRIRRKDGSWIWIHDHATATHQENGTLYADGAFSDISERKKGEAELQWKTAFLEAQTNSTMDGMALVDPNGLTIYANHKFIQMLPKTPDIIVERREHGMLQYVLTITKDPERFRTMANYLNQHPTEIGRSEFELANGTILDVYSSPVIDSEGKYYGRIWTTRDITVQKHDEDMLRQLSMAVEQSPASVVITDPANKISYVNRKFTEITGYMPEEVLGKTPALLKSGLTSPETYRDLRSTIRQGREWSGEFCNRKKNGEIFWEAATIRPITDPEGKITHYLALKEDITERRRVEREFRLTQFSVEHASDAVEWIDSEGHILYVNQAECRDLGLSHEEILNLSVSDIDPLFPKEVWTTFWSDLKTKGSLTFETQHQSKQGRIFPVEITTTYLNFDRQEYCLAFVRDITERRRAEEELRASRQMLQSILDAIPQRVFWKDRNCIYLGCNRPFATDAGLQTPAEIVGKSDFDLSWAGVAALYRADDELVMEQCSPKLDFHERQTRSDGSQLWLQTNKLPLLDLNGNVVGLVGTYEDITGRKQAERELRLTKYSLDVASDTIFWVDPDARIVYANEGACRKLGRSREELLSLSIPDIVPAYSMEDWRCHWNTLKAASSLTFEARHASKQGRIFPVEVTANYLEFDEQEYSFSFVRDITERRELESQLRQAQKLEGIGQLASGIAHEINTPTQFVTDNLTFLRDSWKATHDLLQTYRTAIRNSAALLPPGIAAELENAEQTCDLDFVVAEVPRAIDQSLDGARRVAEIVRAMKEFSHPDAADKTATDLNKAVTSTVTVARNEWKYVADVATCLDETLPRVVCYPGDVNQVILNLVVNAAHAIKEKAKDGEKGKITVCTRVRDEFAEISVTDTGTGIPEAIRTRIFDPFFTTKEVGKGTGQGLSLAHAVVVKKHGGRIWFETEMGRGTTFFINLPIKPPDHPKER